MELPAQRCRESRKTSNNEIHDQHESNLFSGIGRSNAPTGTRPLIPDIRHFGCHDRPRITFMQ